MHKLLLCAFLVCLAATASFAGDLQPRAPGPKDKCPVCGMFVKPYKDWVAQIHFKDGAVFFFDGAKDLFKFYFNIKKYAPQQSQPALSAIMVTEYYGLKPVDAREAFFVLGSDVYGPMGRELIPCATREQAAEFLKDHKATKILTFTDITPAVIKGLD